MTADEVIESYVRDVAWHLPRRKRDDVAFELRALLADELAAKAHAANRAPDKAMAVELMRSFGRPAEVARRYHDRPAIIEPADTHHFVIWTVAGAVCISFFGLLSATPSLNGKFFLQWLGLLVVVFAAMGWCRRRSPGVVRWKPSRGPDAESLLVGFVSTFCTLIFPFFMYVAPQTFVSVMFFGAVINSGVELTPEFLWSWQRIATIVVLGSMVMIHGAVMVRRRWSPRLQWSIVTAHATLALLCFIQAAPMHPLMGGETFRVFVLPKANDVAAPIFYGLGAFMILCALYGAYLEWMRIKPAPALGAGAEHAAGSVGAH